MNTPVGGRVEISASTTRPRSQTLIRSFVHCFDVIWEKTEKWHFLYGAWLCSLHICLDTRSKRKAKVKLVEVWTWTENHSFKLLFHRTLINHVLSLSGLCLKLHLHSNWTKVKKSLPQHIQHRPHLDGIFLAEVEWFINNIIFCLGTSHVLNPIQMDTDKQSSTTITSHVDTRQHHDTYCVICSRSTGRKDTILIRLHTASEHWY